MKDSSIDRVVDGAKTRQLNRRTLVSAASALGASGIATLALGGAASAQATPEASPEASPAASPGASPAASPVAYNGPVGTLSVSSADFYKALNEKFHFEAAGKTGGTLIEINTSDIVTVNPLLSSDIYSTEIIGLYNDTLIQSSPIDGSFVPALADSWEIGPDGVTYTFHLHDGVKWSDGEPFTADDVVYSFDATVAENSTSIRRADVLAVLASYKKIDDLTVQLVAKTPVATFLDKTANQVGIAAKHIWESVPFDKWGTDAGSTGQDPKRVVGTGPFLFKEWVQNDHVTLVKNPNYWNAANAPVNIDTFIYRVVADPNAALQSLKTGESDIFGVEPSQAESLKASNPEINLSIYDTFSFGFYGPNEDQAKTSLFKDIPVRQALHYALDRDLIAKSIYLGYAIRADGSEPVPSPAYAPDKMNTIYKYDPDKAKQLLADAGWTDSDGDGFVDKDGVKFSFECEYPEGIAAYAQQLPYMQQAWKEVGIEMFPVSVPFPTLVDHVTSSNFFMALLGFSWGVDPDQGPMFRTDAKPPAGFNLTAYSNPKYDKLNDEQNVELDVKKRIDLLIEQTNIVNDEMATGVTTFTKAVVAATPRVHNFFANAYGYSWAYSYVWLED